MGWVLILPCVFFFALCGPGGFRQVGYSEDCFSAQRIVFLHPALQGFLFCPAGVSVFSALQGFLSCPWRGFFVTCPARASFLPCRGFFSALRGFFLALERFLCHLAGGSFLPCSFFPARLLSWCPGASFLPCRVLFCPARSCPAGASFLPCANLAKWFVLTAQQ